MGILDSIRATKNREEALERVASPEEAARWIAKAVIAIHWAAEQYTGVTSDLVWQVLVRNRVGDPPEPRAMGAAFKQARKEGWIIPTDTFVASERPSRNGAPIRVWSSRVWKAHPAKRTVDLSELYGEG